MVQLVARAVVFAHHTDIVGAQAVGMPTILVRTGKYAYDAQKPLPVQPDWTIDSIAELPALLGVQ